MPHALSTLATIVLELVLAASGGLLARKLCLRSLVKDLAVGSAIALARQDLSLGGEGIEPDKQRSIDVADGHSLRRLVPQHIELMSKDQDFGLQCCPRPDESDHRAPDQSAEVALSADSLETVSRFEFPVGTGDRIERLRRKLQTIEELKNDLTRYAGYPAGCPDQH